MINYYPASLKMSLGLHQNFHALAQVFQFADWTASLKQQGGYLNQETYKQWLKAMVSKASMIVKEYRELLKQILQIVCAYKKEDLANQSLKVLAQYKAVIIDNCRISFKMQNQFIQFVSIFKFLKQAKQLAWEQYKYAFKDLFRLISSENLELINYFSSLKFKEVPSMKNNEYHEKNIIKTILNIIFKLRIDGCCQSVKKQIQKIEEQNTRVALREFGEYYDNYCINILKKETKFFQFLEVLSRNESTQCEIDKSFKRLDKTVQTTFSKLKNRFIQLLSKHKIAQRDIDYGLEVAKLQSLLKKKDQKIDQFQKTATKEYNTDYLLQNNYKEKKVIKQDKISKSYNLQIQDLELKNNQLLVELCFLRQENEQFKKKAIQHNKNLKISNVISQILKKSSEKKQTIQLENIKSLEGKLSQTESTIESMQIQINRLSYINKDKQKNIDQLQSQLNTLKKNSQKHKAEGEKVKPQPARFSVNERIPQAKSRQLDILIQNLNDSQAMNIKYIDQITALKDSIKQQKQKYDSEIERIHNEYNKKLSLFRVSQIGSKKAELISSKSQLIQKLYNEIQQLSALLSAAKENQGRLRQQILFYQQQLQGRVLSLNSVINSSAIFEQKYKGDHNKEQQNNYQQNLNKLIQLNKQSLLAKEEKILMLSSRINQLEAQNHQLMITKFMDHNSRRK